MDSKNTFAQNLKELRETAGIGQVKLANDIGG